MRTCAMGKQGLLWYDTCGPRQPHPKPTSQMNAPMCAGIKAWTGGSLRQPAATGSAALPGMRTTTGQTSARTRYVPLVVLHVRAAFYSFTPLLWCAVSWHLLALFCCLPSNPAGHVCEVQVLLCS